MRATIHLDHPSTLSMAISRGEIRLPLYCAQARPSRYRTSVLVEALTPWPRDEVKMRQALERMEAGELTAHQMEVNLAWYRWRCETRWDALGDGAFELDHLGLSDGSPVYTEDARPGSDRWRAPSTRELLVPYLARDGADVVLYGRRVTCTRAGEIVYLDEFVADEHGEERRKPFLVEEFGWPAPEARSP